MINERVQISLKPKGRACFVDVSSITEDQSDYKRVQIKDADLGRKLGYTEMLDVISYFHLAQSSMGAQMATASVEPKQLPATSETSSEALEAMAKPTRSRRKSKAPAKATTAWIHSLAFLAGLFLILDSRLTPAVFLVVEM